VAEIPSTRLRVKTVVLARVSYNISSLASNVVMPYMLNPTALGWKSKVCFVWAGTCALCWIWCYYRLPEPKGLTYMELDILFEKRATARQFRKFQVHLAETGYFSLSASDKTRGPQGWRGIS
jgi:MFS transporter, SP family, general alpha glucoside:H+ symporter